MTPDFKVNIWDANDELYTVRLLTLLTWASGLKCKLKTGMELTAGLEDVVRRELDCPDSYPTTDLYDHLYDSLVSIHEQMDVPFTMKR